MCVVTTERRSPGPYRLEDLAEYVRALPAELGIGSTHFVGLSMGGMIEQVAVAYPVLVDSLLLADALSACGKVRIAAAGGSHGMESLVEPTVARWFTEPFRNANPYTIDWMRGLIRADPAAGFIGCCRAPMRLDLNDKLAGVRVRAQIVVGRQDPTTPVAGAEVIKNAIPNARLEIIEDAAHISNVEQPDAFSAMLDVFLAEVT